MKLLFLFLTLTASGLCCYGQAPGVPIEVEEEWTGDKAILARAAVLRESNKLVPQEQMVKWLAKPVPEPVTLPPARTTELKRPDIYETARLSRVRVGWYYKCEDCKAWHTDLAGGYPVTADGVIATCLHVAEPLPEVKEGFMIVVDTKGNVFPVTSVIAANKAMDSCLLRAAGTFVPLPLNDQVRPGDAAYCLSDPLGYNGYFSEGMVNRFYRMPDEEGTPDELLRLNVSTDWAPGSSGSPVLDQCGNVIGHVSTIAALTEEPEEEAEEQPDFKTSPADGKKLEEAPAEEDAYAPGTQIVLHEASPARAVMQLAKAATAAAEAASPDKKE